VLYKYYGGFVCKTNQQTFYKVRILKLEDKKMATIFYSVSGEGMGHSTRSEVVINHLLAQGHELVLFSYDRSFDYLYDSFKTNKKVLDFVKISGINFVYEKNNFKLGKTIIRESTKISPLLIKNTSVFLDMMLKYNPSLIITDFEPISNRIAKLVGIPLICIDNINFITKCEIDKKFRNSILKQFTKHILRFNGNFNFITAVFDVPLKKKYESNTYLVGPIIGDCFKDAKITDKNFVLVYQTTGSNDKLIDILKQSDEKYIIYGFNKDHTDKNLTFKKQSRKGFVKDLISCKAVIANAGFTLISEAVTLKKPIYSIPVKRQIEQEINGHYIAKSGYGLYSKEINSSDLRHFLDNLTKYRKELSKVNYDAGKLFKLLDEKIDYLTDKYKKASKLKVMLKIKEIYNTKIWDLRKSD
jgi:uncharacterized protein (TIGR00661 family)